MATDGSSLKLIRWMGDSRARVRSFPDAARQQIGYELEMVQHGLDPSDWKPMMGIGAGVREIRVHGDTERRVLYVAKFERAIYVLHAFEKKSRRTPAAAQSLARARYRQMLMWEEQS